MNSLRSPGGVALAVAFLAVTFGRPLSAEDPAGPKPDDPAAGTRTPRIQLAILLDTSGSMQGLINQARTQLWKIVNELATARRDGRPPDLEVALYEYGKSSLAKNDGYLRQIVPLTDDLDKLSEELFSLTTNGGQEYCGWVIDAAVKGLAWSESAEDLKLIFIAGNEPFTQGPVDYKQACRAAIEKGITVNTIFCGPQPEGEQTGWKDGALAADGSFLSINQNEQVATIRTPYDEKLAELGAKVNQTVVTFGRESERRAALQQVERADELARRAAPAAAAERAGFKGSGGYAARSDLVEAVKDKRVELEGLGDEELPEELRGKTLDERKSILAAKEADRAKLQTEIQKLSAERRKFIAEHEREQAQSDKHSTFDTAVLQTIREQASKKRFVFAE
ncbi:MAG TPA: vWA domain-containing protein [Planctomycetaceae bacterium]|nr:vWA domain-containing protein [Planctomycetaceae bacterium]